MLRKLSSFETYERDGVKVRRGMIGNNLVEIKETTNKHGEKWYHARANDNPETTKLNMDEGGLMGWLMRLVGR